MRTLDPSKVQFIVVHCTASNWGTLEVVDSWHRERGFDMIGYHYLIENGYETHAQFKEEERGASDGLVRQGRRESDEGAHCIGLNPRSLGVCFVGANPDGFTEKQFRSGAKLIVGLMRKYEIPLDHVIGHYEAERFGGVSYGKTCPNISMHAFRAGLKQYINARTIAGMMAHAARVILHPSMR